MEIRRDKYLDLLIHSCGNGLIKVITGMRRCGKSYLLFTLFKNYLIKEGVYIINLMDFLRDPEKYMEERV
jgi:predicted AAA+ superfamily ATPase